MEAVRRNINTTRILRTQQDKCRAAGNEVAPHAQRSPHTLAADVAPPRHGFLSLCGQLSDGFSFQRTQQLNTQYSHVVLHLWWHCGAVLL